MERWTFLIIAGPDGAPVEVRVFLRAGDDEARWPSAQIALDGREVAVDEAAHDFEAPEWRVAQLLAAAGGQDVVDRVKDRLRAAAGV